MGTLSVFPSVVCVFLIMDSRGMCCPHSLHTVHITGEQVIPSLHRSPIHLYCQIPVALTWVVGACSLTLHGAVNMAPSSVRLWRLCLEFWSLL